MHTGLRLNSNDLSCNNGAHDMALATPRLTDRHDCGSQQSHRCEGIKISRGQGK